MRTLRSLSYASATILTSFIAMGCSGDTGADSSSDGTMPAASSSTGPDGTITMVNPDGSITTINPDGSVTVTTPDGTVMPVNTVPGAEATPPVAMPAPSDGSTPAVPGGPAVTAPDCAAGVSATSQVPRLLNREYDRIIEDLLGMTTLASGAKPSTLLNADYDGPMDTFVWNAYQTAAAAISAEVIANPTYKANFISCDPATVATCYEDTVRAFGRKALRHPLSDEEVARFMPLTTIEPAGTPDQIAEALLNAFLVSPSFIMVPEMSADEMEGTSIKLSPHEVAMRLSLMLWGSVPDEELNMAADANMLGTKELILAQAQRMIEVREKSAGQVAGAHRNYLVMDEASHWWKSSHESEVFPGYSDSIRPTMQAELDKFFEEVAFTGGSFRDVLLSNVGFVNQDTAALYGLDPADYGPELEKVELTDRPGFLTRVGFLSSFTNAEVTSPILRGAFITVNMIGVNPGAPDADATKTPIPPGTYTTRREQIEALTEPDSCTGCHTQFVNPPGFVLENYDPIGRWQDTDPLGGAINATATVAFSRENTKEISSAQQLMEEIAANPESRRIYAERLVSYATGRLPNDNDACTVSVAAANLSQDGYTVLNLLADLTQADSFRLRTVGN